MKFGGTSTQDAAAMTNVVAIVRSRLAEKPMLVISAIAQATNILEQAGALAAAGRGGEAVESLRNLAARHRMIIETIIHDPGRRAGTLDAVAAALGELEELVRGVAILRELTPAAQDSFCAYGELLSSRIVAAALAEAGIRSAWLDTRDFLLTDDAFNRASPVWPVVEERLAKIALPLIAEGVVPVTQGFIGITSSGRRTTMGRESSDYSAAIIGTALRVADIQIWTDVDGVLTADPRIVEAPRKIRELTFEEAYELSYFGAKVLHPKTMLPAVEKNIPIHIYNSRKPGRSGTKVAAPSGPVEPMLKSVASKRPVALVTVTPKRRLGQYILWEHIQALLTRHDAAAGLTVTSEYNYAFVLDWKKPMPALLEDLAEIGAVDLLAPKGIICAVGTRLRESPGILARIFKAVAPLGVDLVSFGASPSSVSFIVAEADAADAVRRIHAEFFDGGGDLRLFEPLEAAAPQPQGA